MRRLTLAALWAAATLSAGPIAYGVSEGGLLFRFDVDTPSAVTPIGNLGFVPAAIDFRPSSNTLYAIGLGRSTSQLYTVDINTGAPTAVGAGFATAGAGYDLSGGTVGFDFNPTTLQPDSSMRIRVVTSNGSNLRLNSSTGAISNTDAALNPGNPGVDGAAYINNIARAGGVTTLYTLSFANDNLNTQAPPNNGTTNPVGPMGVTIDALGGIGFDIFTDPASADDTIGGDSAYAVLRRPDAPVGNPGIYLLYRVNLATGQIANGAIVGLANSPYDFTGGFAILPAAIPEPGTFALSVLGLALVAVRYRGRVR